MSICRRRRETATLYRPFRPEKRFTRKRKKRRIRSRNRFPPIIDTVDVHDRTRRAAAYHFVRLVGTVEVAVAAPFQRDAIVVFHAREFGNRARDVRTVQLVRAVLTVVVFVAHPNFLYTLAVAARELVVSARFI